MCQWRSKNSWFSSGAIVSLNLFVCRFGLSEAPRKFTKLLVAPLSTIRQAGFTIAAYLDDFFQCENTYEWCCKAVQFAYNLLVSLGFLPNFEKSSLIPSQRIEALGHVIDSHLMLVFLPPSKTTALVQLCEQSLAHPSMSIRHLASIIGKLIACFIAHPLGRLHYRSLERLKVKSLRRHRGDFESTCTLDTPCIADLQWWINTLPTAAAPINRGNATVVMTTDASEQMWAACFNGMTAHSPFTETEFPHSINTKETMAILFGLKAFKHYFAHQHLLIMSDSTSAVSFVRKNGFHDVTHSRFSGSTNLASCPGKQHLAFHHTFGRLFKF